MYITYLPWHVELHSGLRVKLKLSQILNTSIDTFAIKIPSDEIHSAYKGLISRGFYRAIPSVNKGEVYGLAKIIRGPWELHIRIYKDGLVKGEVEVSRRYLQHLISNRVNVVYEVYELIKDAVSTRSIVYLPLNQRVVNVLDNIRVELKQPRILIPWGLEVFNKLMNVFF